MVAGHHRDPVAQPRRQLVTATHRFPAVSAARRVDEPDGHGCRAALRTAHGLAVHAGYRNRYRVDDFAGSKGCPAGLPVHARGTIRQLRRRQDDSAPLPDPITRLASPGAGQFAAGAARAAGPESAAGAAVRNGAESRDAVLVAPSLPGGRGVAEPAGQRDDRRRRRYWPRLRHEQAVSIPAVRAASRSGGGAGAAVALPWDLHAGSALTGLTAPASGSADIKW